METIFHEQQEGSLCAQHCLNALLQAQYFSPVDLADLAKQLDESEREQMAIAGEQSEEYKKFLKEPSSNLDDSGFFSIQVIDRALSVWGLGLILYNSPNPVAIAARINPVEEKAYICNFRGHWLTIRKIGHQWFNLNSLLTGPELISNTYLSLFLKQLLEEGYSIFIVGGNLPECEADMLLKIAPVKQQVKPKLINENLSVSSNQPMEEEEDDQQLQKVLAESRHADEHDDQALQKALQLSMEGRLPGQSNTVTWRKSLPCIQPIMFTRQISTTTFVLLLVIQKWYFCDIVNLPLWSVMKCQILTKDSIESCTSNI
ncbi:Ataxin-3 [Mizuhopecten yessoensis]|uniref:Ataxin-3 homolog n=1 Tax=Mizuhopecten yessoensis TaxID=6573 RepID=A0A210QCE6_MIZYE|nr:Ataxin-3 [Mizuhopecten yessoensis]